MLWTVCPRCSGGDPECATCEGRGRCAVRRCPTSHSDPDLSAAFFAYTLVESGVWPVAGGMLDQSASFLAFVREVSAERAAIDDERRKRDGG